MKIELNLLDNGLDFIIEALNHVWGKNNSEEPKLWKYSVLNFFSGAELILKERLKREHWSLIFEDVGSANEKKLIQGDFVSVSHNEIVKRLKGICNININDNPLNDLRKLRNKFEHFEINVSVDDCKKAIASTLQELVPFWDMHIMSFCNEEQNVRFATIKAIINDFDAYVKLAVEKNAKTVEKLLESGNGIVIPCNKCRNTSLLVFKDDEAVCKCFVCNNRLKKAEYLKLIREDENGTSFLPKEDYEIICQTCGKESRVMYSDRFSGNYDFPDYYYCISCFHKDVGLTRDQKAKIELYNRIKELVVNHSLDESLQIIKDELKNEEFEGDE